MIEASTVIVTGVDRRGHTVLRRMHCEVPMLVRVVDEHGPVLHLAMVNGCAGPLGGDRLHLRLELEDGAHVSVRSVAAAMAQPGARDDRSELAVELVVGAGASLDWRPQPTVSVMGSDHRSTMRLEACSSATVSVFEGASLGRHGEPPGRFALRERVLIDGVSVLDHETVFAPGALCGPGAQGPARSMSTQVLIGSCLPKPGAVDADGCLQATVHLSPICALVMARS
ncbi:MAG: urease accessory protein [Ilumatobacteraceae bacterium]